jgi:GTP-binding protein LepA
VAITSDVPLREVVVNFHDDLKAATAGYGSFSMRVADERKVDLVKVSVLVNHEPVEALPVLVPESRAVSDGRRMVAQLKTAIPRHLFVVPLQASIGGKIIARETIPALRKDVTGHLYGGDVTRKRKLLEKQKKGKKKLAALSSVHIPPAAYLAILRR